MFVVYIALTLCTKSKGHLKLKKANNRSTKFTSDPVDEDGCYEAYLELVGLYKDLEPETYRQKSDLNGKDKKRNLFDADTAALAAFEATCLKTITVGKCPDTFAKLGATGTTNVEKLAFIADCKVNDPDAGGDGSGDSGLFSSKTSKILLLFGFAIAGIYFQS
jgi:hypothetical protein